MLKRDNNKHGTSRLIRVLGVAAATAVVASLAVAGTVAAQTSRLFDDVPRGHYAYDAIEWAVENKITVGCGDGTNFCPSRTLNRGEVVTFLKRYHDKFGTNSPTSSTTSVDRDADDVVAVLEGTGSGFTTSVSLASGWWRFDFEIEHDDRIASVLVKAVDDGTGEVTLVDEIPRGDEYFETGRFRVGRNVGDDLDPGRIWFEVDARANAEWTIIIY